MNATPENMRLYARPGMFAYDLTTDERFSATAGDYFWQPDTEPLTGADGAPLILAVERCEIVEVNPS